MRLHTRFVSVAVPLLAVVVLASGCAGRFQPFQTFEYRNVQADFIEAARTDNRAAVDPLSASTAEASYASIATDLTPARIAALDPKLQANAWVIRSYSQWRSGSYKEAIESATTGLKAPGVGPRDRVLLQLLPALVVDSETRDLWTAKNRKLVAAEYPDFESRFTQVHAQLVGAEGLVDASAAPSTTYYLAYQRWRLLHNWSIVIATVEALNSPARIEAQRKAERVVGGALSAAADTARNKIPDWHELRQLIRAQGGG